MLLVKSVVQSAGKESPLYVWCDITCSCVSSRWRAVTDLQSVAVSKAGTERHWRRSLGCSR